MIFTIHDRDPILTRRTFHRLEVLQSAATKRKPGYLDQIAKVAEPQLRNGALSGYWMTLDQELELGREFALEGDTASVAWLEAAVADRDRQRAVFNSLVVDTAPLAPPVAKELEQVISRDGPCEFSGCEELRAEYQKAVEAAGKECSSCTLNGIREKFRLKLLALRKDEHRNT
jgi:hypothetical protein